MDNNGPDTLKIPKIEKPNELEYAQYLYDQALDAMLKHPTYSNRHIFIEANAKLVETRYAYQKGSELLTIFNTNHQNHSHLSQNLQPL